MIDIYFDPNGELCEAQQLVDPTVLYTVNGEVVGIAGQWMVRRKSTGELIVMNDDQFKLSFTRGG